MTRIEQRLNKSYKICCRCGSIPKFKMTCKTCPDCADVNRLVDIRTRYNQSPHKERRIAYKKQWYIKNRLRILEQKRLDYRKAKKI